MGNEHEQDDWLGKTLRHTPATASDDCLDAETLAAWADGGLNAQAAAAVELHASQCSRCTAVLAAMERSAPDALASHAWTPARLVRWLVPLTVAATAVAIWIAVPNRPIMPVEPAPAQDLSASAPAPVTPEPESLNQDPEPGTRNRNPEPGTRNQEPVAPPPAARLDKPAPLEAVEMRDESRRERVSQEALDATAAAPTAPPSPAAPPPAAATGMLADTATLTAKRSAFNGPVFSTDSVSPSNPQIRWRLVGSGSIERSRDGGKTWVVTTSPVPTIAGIRAVDADRAVVSTADRTVFYTSNGGLTWTRVQENSTAPF